MTFKVSRIWDQTRELWTQMQRSKIQSRDDSMDTQLRRCLTTFDIILLGIGHMVGSGAYVITSSVAKNISGPSIILSYIIAGLAAFLCALCYAEFSSRFPKCGSAYSYTYIALGEIWAFIVGWSMILENVIGIAAVSRAFSAYLDSTISGEIRNQTIVWLSPIFGQTLTSHMDLMSGFIAFGFAVFLTSGLKITTYINNIFSIINICSILIVITVGAYYSDLSNWKNVPGGFMPYGWKGVFAGSASCFYAYVGFDSIATSGEEAKDPQKSIPISTFVSMIFATLSYVGVSAVITLMVPYNQISEESGLPDALGAHGATLAKFGVIVGACCGMATVLIGTIYSLTRIVYAIADDGLLFPWMSFVNQKTQIPLMSMFFFTGFGIILAIFIDITTLIEMMSIGTLLAYLVVSASIIVVRYQRTPNDEKVSSTFNGIENQPAEDNLNDEQDRLIDEDDDECQGPKNRLKETFKDLLNKEIILRSLNRYFHDSLVSVCVFLIVVLASLFCLICKLYQKGVDEKLVAFFLSLISTLLILLITILQMHPQNNETAIRYKVPLVPFIPVLSIFFNVSLIINLNFLTWMRFIIWMKIGFILYFFYGIKHSKAEYVSELNKRINNQGIKKWGSTDSSQNEDILMTRE